MKKSLAMKVLFTYEMHEENTSSKYKMREEQGKYSKGAIQMLTTKLLRN